MTEQRMWKILRAAWDGWGHRTEASLGGVEVGFPDCIMGARGGGGVLVELKCRGTPLSREQRAWWADHCDRGGVGFVVCWVRKDVWWIGQWEVYDEDVDQGGGLADVLDRVRRASAGAVG